MSSIYSAGQYERSFGAKRLGNWEVPDATKQKRTTLAHDFGTLTGTTPPTQHAAGDGGHLNKGQPKPNVSYKTGAKATLGYKGIPTTYLPTSTVPLRTYMAPGAKDFNYK